MSGERGLHLGRAHELVDGRDAEGGVDLRVELLAERALDARAQLGERVELARRARQLVVERRQDLLLHLAHGDLDGRGRCRRQAGTRPPSSRRRRRRGAPPRARPPCARRRARRPCRAAPLPSSRRDRRRACLPRARGGRRPARARPRIRAAPRARRPPTPAAPRPRARGTSSVVQSTISGSAWISTVAMKLHASSAVPGSSNSYWGSRDRADAAPRSGAPEPAADVAVDRLGVDPVLAEARRRGRAAGSSPCGSPGS